MLRKLIVRAAACVAALSLTVGAGMARDLVYGSWMSANASTNKIALPAYFDMIKKATNGDINWKLVPGGQLATGSGTVEAVKGGLVDGGTTMAPYTPRDLPATNLLFNKTLLGRDAIAATGAMNEVLMLHCPQCLAEYKRNNAVGFAGYSTTYYLLMCRRPIHTIADLKGVKVRSSGGGVKIMTLAGATPVAMNPAEATTALERGVIDCVLGSLAWLRNYGYMDVVTNVLDYPMGMAGPPLLAYINRDTWNSMTPAERKAHLESAARLVAIDTIKAQVDVDASVKKEALAKGIKFTEGGEDFAAVMAERAKDQVPELLQMAKNTNVKDAQGLLDAYDAAYAKWKKISKDQIRDNIDKFAEALQREVFSNVDPNSL